MSQRPILVTGFGPFGSVVDNPSARVADALREEGRVVARILPVSYAKVAELLPKLLKEIRPRAVVSFGIAAKADRILLERFFLNVCDGPPDVDGTLREGQIIQPRGPAARISTLPLPAAREAMAKTGAPVACSNHAGAYLCNFIGYLAATHVARNKGPRASGFVHLPPIEAVPLETQIAAARALLKLL
jgi:pyroglutamyl-peptidase